MTFLVRFFFFKAIYGCEVHPFQSCKPGENLPGSIPNLRRSHHGDDVVTGHQTSSWLGSPIAGWFHGKSPKWMITRGTPMNGKPPYHNIIYIHIYIYIYINIRYRLWFIYILVIFQPSWMFPLRPLKKRRVPNTHRLVCEEIISWC